MKLKSLYALLFCIFMTGCLDGQKQSDHSILIAYMSTEYPELGSSVCYLNEQGDTIVPFGKYHYGGSDTIRHIGFVNPDGQLLITKEKNFFMPLVLIMDRIM